MERWREGRRVEALLAAADLMLEVSTPKVARVAMPREDLVGLRELRELMTPSEFPEEWKRSAWAVQFGFACLLGSEPAAAEVIVHLVEFLERRKSSPEARFQPLGGKTPLRSWRDLEMAERGLVVREAGLLSEFSARQASEMAQEDMEWLGWWSAVKLGAGILEAEA